MYLFQNSYSISRTSLYWYAGWCVVSLFWAEIEHRTQRLLELLCHGSQSTELISFRLLSFHFFRKIQPNCSSCWNNPPRVTHFRDLMSISYSFFTHTYPYQDCSCSTRMYYYLMSISYCFRITNIKTILYNILTYGNESLSCLYIALTV